jgi:hypothetical protein
MAKSVFKITYSVVDNDRKSADFGLLVDKVKRVSSFKEAVTFTHIIANTSINLVGKPIIEEI